MTRHVTISEETQVDLPATREFMPIERRDWRRVKGKVSKLNIDHNRWENAAWAVASLSAGAFYSAYANPPGKRAIFVVIGVCLLAIMVLLFLVSARASKDTDVSKQEVLDEMEEIEGSMPDVATVPAAPAFFILSASYATTKASFNVKEKLDAMIEDNRLRVKASNDIAGDPDRGTHKELRIKYKVNEQILERTYNEGELVDLP